METTELARILLVEDDPDIQLIARMSLEASGEFVVDVCDRGAKALETAPTFRPDLILLDVMMPGMDGPTTMQALRDKPETADIPIVFMTAKVQTEDRRRYLEMGALGVIAKPFDPLALVAKIREIWAASTGDSSSS